MHKANLKCALQLHDCLNLFLNYGNKYLNDAPRLLTAHGRYESAPDGAPLEIPAEQNVGDVRSVPSSLSCFLELPRSVVDEGFQILNSKIMSWCVTLTTRKLQFVNINFFKKYDLFIVLYLLFNTIVNLNL